MLDQGSILEQGTYDGLVASGGGLKMLLDELHIGELRAHEKQASQSRSTSSVAEVEEEEVVQLVEAEYTEKGLG